MTQISPIIEIHFYSSGLKAKHIGSQPRPEWLPSFEIVGLKDIQLDNDDYVIELSRHERENKLITWIGVWSKGVDLTAGDRGANYIGLGVWLIDVLPIESHLIVDSLVKICDQLVKEGTPSDKVQNSCNTLLNDPSYMQKWIKDINELPLVDKGLVFQKDSYLQTIYIKPKDRDLKKAIIAISESILINCVNAVADFKDKSQILYLILNPGSKADSNKAIIELSNNPNICNIWLDYISILEHSIEEKNVGLLHNVDKLKNENQSKSNQIKINEDNINELNVLNKKLNEQINKKTESEQFVDLEAKIVNLIKQIEQKSTDLQSKENVVRQAITAHSNSNDEVLKQIKDLYFLITNQNSTLNSIGKTNGSLSEQFVDLEAKIVNLIRQIEQKSTDLQSKENVVRQTITSHSNSNDEVLKQIKDLHFLIKNQTSTLNLFDKTNGSVKSNPAKPAIHQYRIYEGIFSRYSFLIFIGGIVLALISAIGYGVYSKVSPDVIQEQPQSRNTNIDDVKKLNSKLDKISTTVDFIQNNIESSNTVKELKVISPIGHEHAPSNSGKIGKNKKSGK